MGNGEDLQTGGTMLAPRQTMKGMNRRTSTMVNGQVRQGRVSEISGLRPINNSKLEAAKKMTEKTLGSAKRTKANYNHD